MDVVMQCVRERFDTGRPVRGAIELEIKDRGPLNHHCANCGSLLIRNAGDALPDVIVVCPVCLTLNEPAHLPGLASN